MIKGKLVQPAEETTTQGTVIDFALASAAIASCIHVEVDWEVPFKPHAAVKYTVHKGGINLPVPQAPRFTPEPGDYQEDQEAQEVTQVTALFENPRTHPPDVRWGSCIHKLETQLSMDQQGRSWCFPVVRKPLVQPTSPQKQWNGGKVAYWERMQLWVLQKQERPLKPSQFRLFKRQLCQMHQFWDPESPESPGDIQAKLEAYMIGHSVDVETVQTVLKKAKAEAQEWQKQRRAQYQKWLEGACAGGMRGLYKALRSPENVQARPYREQSGELRPHLRRQEWKAVWQPMPDNQAQQDPLFDQLAAGARLQLEQLGPLRDEVVAKVLGKVAKKAVGPDGLSAQMFRGLKPDQVALVAQAFREWESTGYMPDTVTMTLVTLLAKKETEERPIGLTSYAYRAWCKTRYHLYDEWAKQYKAVAPWDRAIKGLSSLEVAVTRVLKGEMHRQSGKTGITLLLDLKGFYENVSHTALVEVAFKHQYPPLLLHGAMQVYRGKRHVCAENMVSAPIVATKGIIAGCPLAPGLSKLVMHDVVSPIWYGSPKCHVDLYIDDTGFDIVGQDAKECARKAYLVWTRVKQQLNRAKLPLSAGKSAWVCSNPRAEKELNRLLKAEDPQVKSLAKDLGIDSGWGRRRRVTTHKARFDKGAKRQQRLAKLRPPQKSRVTACKQGIFGVSLYGHVAVGLAPKRLKWVRHQHACALGRMSLGSTEAVIEQATNKHDDPTYTVINQHFRFLHKLLVEWTQTPFDELEVAFQHWVRRVQRHKEPWRIVVGPFGAAACYIKALGWEALTLTQWRAGDETFHLLDRASMQGLSRKLRHTCDQWRWDALAQREKGHTLKQGIEWQAPRRALKKTPSKLHRNALVAVWQGAIRHGKGATCTRCNQEATLSHVLWECSWWKNQHPEPQDFAMLRQKYPDPSLWLRGLGPPHVRPGTYQQQLVEEGIFQQRMVEDPSVFYATDGSPGASQDERFQIFTWGVIAFRIRDQDIEVLGKATGPVEGDQSVFRAEAAALLYVARKTEGDVDVTLDCKGVLKCLRKAPGWKSEDILQPLRQHKDRLKPTWINSHMTPGNFQEKFGQQNWWRWKANQVVDELVQKVANQHRDLNWEQQVIIQDEVVMRVNAFLADRVQRLFLYPASDGPLVSFPDKTNDQDQLSPAGKKKPGPKAKQILKTKGRKDKAGGKPVKAPTSEGPNKRQQLEALLAGQGPDLGHDWQAGHRSRDNLCVKCARCGHFIEQVESKAIFAKKITHTCQWMEPSAPGLGEHASHKMVNAGRMWLCCRCGVRQWISRSELFPSLAKQCRQVYLGTDPDILQCIQKFAPSKAGFFKPSLPVPGPAPQTNEAAKQASHTEKSGKNLTSDGDDVDKAGGLSAGGGVASNQGTSAKTKSGTKGGEPRASSQPQKTSNAQGPCQAQSNPGPSDLRPKASPTSEPCLVPVPKTKPKPKAPGRTRPQSEDPKQTRLRF